MKTIPIKIVLFATLLFTHFSFYAQFKGGNNDGAALAQLTTSACTAFPTQFSAYFGGSGDGFTVNKTPQICSIALPIANFSASTTSVCVGQTVTFTDTSTESPTSWLWTLPGGTPNSATVQNPVVTYSTAGTYSVTLKATNYNGNNTKVVTAYITVVSFPTITATTDGSNCGAGTVTLGATASAGTLIWYDMSTGGTALGSGTSFTTPSLTASTTFYVEAVNASCNSQRTAVFATVRTVPVLTSTTPASRCGSGQVTLSATTSVGVTYWYANATGGPALSTVNSFTTPVISTTTTYYAQATTNSCTSARTAVTATIDNLQTITATTPATRCDAGSVTLTATASGGTLNWYAAASGGTSLATGSSFATPSISATTTYYVAVSSGACTSARIAVTATITNQSAPTGTANQSFCSNETVGQLVTNGTNINWYNSATSNTVLPNSTLLVSGSTYYATQTVSGCESTTRLAITVQTGNCLGDETFSKLVGLKLYPNPVIDVLNVSYTDKISAIEIISILGQTIENNTINTNETQIDMSRLSSGSYLIKVIANDKSEIFKVIKK